MTVYTTLNEIREHKPCEDGWKALLKGLNKSKADNDPLALTTILDINGLNDAVWTLRTVEDEKLVRLFAVACCQDILHLIEDERSLNAVKIAHLYCHGEATKDELEFAYNAVIEINTAPAYTANINVHAVDYAVAYAAATYAVAYKVDYEGARNRQERLFRIMFG